VLFVIAVYHALKQGDRFISQGTGIEVNQQEDGEYKAHDDMQDIVKQESANIEYGAGYFLRKHECNSGDNQQGHTKIHGKYIGYFLKRIEFLFLGDGEGMGITFKNSDGIELKLFPEFRPKVFSPLPVVHAISRKHIAKDKNPIVNGEDNSTYIMKHH
jgi:hypothetical protein